LRAFAHALQTPVLITARAQYFSVDPAAVIANQDPQGLSGILELDFDFVCAGVAGGIDQRFSTDEINFMVGGRLQRLRCAPNNESKANLVDFQLDGEFFVASQECPF
jgi:hypothetical protein